MSQEIKLNNLNSDSYADQMASEPWSTETYADKLMDDLFSDLDQILDTTGKLPEQPIQPTYISLQEIKVAEVTMPPAVIQNPPSPSVSATPVKTPRKKLKKSALVPVVSSQKTVKSKWSFGEYLEKIIWIVTFLSLVGTLILWLVHEKKINWLFALTNNTGQKTQLSKNDQEFIKYMMESMENIERTSKPTQPQKQSKIPANQPPTLNNQKSTPPTPIVIQPQIYIPYATNPPPTVPLTPRSVIKPTSQPVNPKTVTPQQQQGKTKTITPQSVVPRTIKPAYFVPKYGSVQPILPYYLMPRTVAVSSKLPQSVTLKPVALKQQKSKTLGLFKTIPLNFVTINPLIPESLRGKREVSQPDLSKPEITTKEKVKTEKVALVTQEKPPSKYVDKKLENAKNTKVKPEKNALVSREITPVKTRKITESKPSIVRIKERKTIVAANNNNDSIILPVPVTPPPSSNNGAILPKIMPPQIIQPSDQTNTAAIINNPNGATLNNNNSPVTSDTNKYTLTGLLQLGDQSVALFEINGINQRIKAGESIGSSGWNIVSISGQEVVIRRNGEVRSVYVGQKF